MPITEQYLKRADVALIYWKFKPKTISPMTEKKI